MGNKQYRLNPEEYELIKTIRLLNVNPNRLKEELLIQKTKEITNPSPSGKPANLDWKKIFK